MTLSRSGFPLRRRWEVRSAISTEADQQLAQFSPTFRQLLFNRGITSLESAQDYLEARPPQGSDPLNLSGMPDAVERIRYAIESEQLIAVYGDYDVDGVTATALLSMILESLGAQVRRYIPNRFDEGYGLNIEALDTLYDEGVRLVISVDCGIRSVEEAEHARRKGLDLVITDHHHPHDQLPQAVAIINPKQNGETYPERDLSGVGLAYKLACAIFNDHASLAELQHIPSPASYLDLVALGTIADMVPLKGENRCLVRGGLEYLNRPHRQGIQSLIGASGINSGRITATDVGFILGPRLNAAGRLESALDALELLTTRDLAQAASLAQKLDNQNRERQHIMRQISSQAEQMVLEKDPQALLLFAADPGFNPGVVGLAASRLLERFYRPSIVAYQGEIFTRASCRSIPEFHITDALDQVADLLVHHGGHAAAAGFTVRNTDVPQLLQRLQVIAEEQLAGKDLRPVLSADLEIPLSELHPDLLKELAWLQPTGQGNPEAVFISRHLRVLRSRSIGKDSSHMRLSVSDGYITFDAIAFRQGHWITQMPSLVDLAYVYEMNQYNGNFNLQLNVRDLRPSGS